MGEGFNGFFKELKGYTKRLNKNKKLLNQRNGKQAWSDRIMEIDKKSIIIFSVKGKKLSKVKINEKKKYVFPFDRVFLECEIIHKTDNGLDNCEGILFQKMDGVIVCSTLWCIHNVHHQKSIYKMSHLSFREEDLSGLLKEESQEDLTFSEDGYSFGKTVHKEIIQIIKRFMETIDKKEYLKYKKWTPGGFIEKEIVHAHDVRSHKRHFWKDSGRFKIPFLPKEELNKKGYGLDELVFRDCELRRDVPFKMIGQFRVGGEKELAEDNRRIILLEKRVFRQEEKLLKVLHEIFPQELIRRHDRKVLKGLELDFLLREKRIAFEYDGEQHFDRRLCEDVFKSDFEALQRRDRTKDKLCKKKNIRLIRVKYDEPLTKTNILKKLKL